MKKRFLHYYFAPQLYHLLLHRTIIVTGITEITLTVTITNTVSIMITTMIRDRRRFHINFFVYQNKSVPLRAER